VASGAARSDNKRVKTLRLIVNPKHLDTAEAVRALEQAAEILRRGGLVAMPTETVYGLGANALNAEAVASIFVAKQRPKWDPVIVHVAGPNGAAAMMRDLVREVPETARKLMAAYWPGPLTLLLPRTEAVPDVVTAGRPLMGVRMPSHPVAAELIRRAGVPVAAPSANTFGHTSPTTAAHVLADLDGRIDAVVDAGPAEHGLESTVLDPGQNPMMIYRPGAVTKVQIQEVAGAVEIFHDTAELATKPQEAMPAPGIGLRHYAPKARLLLIEGELPELEARLAEAAEGQTGERVGVMLPSEIAPPKGTDVVFAWGRWAAPREMARKLYAGLRALDSEDCTVILCPLPPSAGIGAAIRDRLLRAGKRKSGNRR
jgi:L-threonylcarbamoyladenylate synthase